MLVALGANFAIGVLKLVAGLITGSAAMLAEAGHSVADTFTEALLLTALRRSSRPADRSHPFGYGKERYFWSLMAAVSIFTSGALFAFYEGFRAIFGEPREQQTPARRVRRAGARVPAGGHVVAAGGPAAADGARRPSTGACAGTCS